MIADPVDPSAAGTPSTNVSSADDAAVFQQLMSGFLATGLSLANSIVGDAVETLNQADEAA